MAAGLIGCSTLAGLGDPDDPFPINEAGISANDVRTTEAEASVDAGRDREAAIEPNSCPAKDAYDGRGKLHAEEVVIPVTIDGKRGEWECADAYKFETGDRADGLAAGQASALVAMQWDAQNLYLFARVRTRAPTGDAGAAVNYQNDGFHIYLVADGATADYRNVDHHFAFDVLGRLTDYDDPPNGARPGPPANVTYRVTTPVPDGADVVFDIEAKFAASVVNRGGFVKGDKVHVNFQVNDSAGGGGVPPYRLWYVDVGGVCPVSPNCNVNNASEPYCDPRCTGDLELR